MPYVRRTAIGRRPIFMIPQYLKTRTAIGSGIGIGAGLLIGVALGIRDGSRPPALGEGAYQLGTIVATATACATEAATHEAGALAVDAPALAAFMLDSANRCTTLDRGTPIEVDEARGPLDGIHVRGSPDALWVPANSVR